MAKKTIARTLKVYKSYNFRTKDPVIDECRTIRADAGNPSLGKISEGSGLSTAAMNGWFNGKTERPQFATIAAFMGYFGKEARWVSKRKP